MRDDSSLDAAEMRTFGGAGYIVVPDVIPRDLIGACMRAVDRLVENHPPQNDDRGPFFYWYDGAELETLASPLHDNLLLSHYMLGHNIGGNVSVNSSAHLVLPARMRRASRALAGMRSRRAIRI